MKALRVAFAAVALLAGLAAAVPAAAHGYYGGQRGYWYGPGVRFHFGGPLWWGAPYYYGPPYGYGYATPPYGYAAPPYGYGYGPPPVVTSPAPPVYIERDQEAPSARPADPPPAAQWWYLCSSPRGAYPYVRECPGGWDRLPAIPPGQTR